MSIVFDFEDINRRVNRRPLIEPSKAEGPPVNLMPEFYTWEEGGVWKPWSQFKVGDQVHSIKFDTGEEWDVLNGLRKKKP